MEAIINIIIVLLLGSFIAKRAKRLSQTRPGQASKPAQPDLPRKPVWPDMLPPELRELLSMGDDEAPREVIDVHGEIAEPKPVAPDADMAEGTSGEGFSREQRDGCIGGSLPHADDEYFAPAEPIAALAPIEQEIAKPAAAVAPEDLRRAVVMAELLARPVALRARGHRI